MSATIAVPIEQRETFACFGSHCTVIVADARVADAQAAVALARRRLLEWHEQFSRFETEQRAHASERRSGRDRARVPDDATRRRGRGEGRARHRGLVDPTLLAEIERAGYDGHLEPDGLPLAVALALAPARAPGHAAVDPAWRRVRTDRRAGTVTRPPGVRIDPGGIAKGVFADELAALLSGYGAFVVDCGGDMRLGGSLALARDVHVASPFDESTLHTFALAGGGVATSGIGRRGWIDRDGTSGPPPARPRDRPAGVHGDRPGHCARADRDRGRGARARQRS